MYKVPQKNTALIGHPAHAPRLPVDVHKFYKNICKPYFMGKMLYDQNVKCEIKKL